MQLFGRWKLLVIRAFSPSLYIISDHTWLSPANFTATYNWQIFHDMPGKKLEIFGKEHSDYLKLSLFIKMLVQWFTLCSTKRLHLPLLQERQSKNPTHGTSLVVQWLRLRVSKAGSMSLILGWGSKQTEYCVVQPKKKKKIPLSHDIKFNILDLCIIVIISTSNLDVATLEMETCRQLKSNTHIHICTHIPYIRVCVG